MPIKTILEFPEKLPRHFLPFVGFSLVLAIGVLDSFTSYDVSVSLLYLVPIMLMAWYEGGIFVAVMSIFSVINWAIADMVSGHIYSHIAIPLWNAIMMLGMFLIIGYTITMLKKLLVKEREHSHDDDLTNVANIRFFYERASIEIKRLSINKRPLSLMYLAIDNLRFINESLGYVTGDFLLHEVAQTMKAALQSTSLISRFGGAEFAILIPGTQTENVTTVISDVQKRLLEMVNKHNWPVTFSIGVVTDVDAAYNIDELINMSKDLMKASKITGKNTVEYKELA
jgi:diguanylate cyclase (GGDEF)-like protein